MNELINNLVNKNYEKYNFLLNVKKISSYKNKLQKLYMEEDDFRTSIELNLIFQICLVIMILEDIYDVTILKEYYDNEQFNDNTKDDGIDDINELKKEEEKNLEQGLGGETEKENNEDLGQSSKNEDEKIISNNEIKKDDVKINNININEEIIYKKEKINELSRNKITNNNNYNITENISNTLAPLKTRIGYFSSINNTEEDKINDNEDKNNNNIIIIISYFIST